MLVNSFLHSCASAFIKHTPALARLSTVLKHVHCFSSFYRTMAYSTTERGGPNTLGYRVFFKNAAGVAVSPFHDIPLVANPEKGTYNMVVEIPRWTNAKMEICKEEKLNPIKQDVKKGQLRYVKNIFPHHGYIWNYGALPQTYEDPNHVTEDTGTKGDSDPLDVCEIGYKIHERGAVVEVKVLGIMCLIDEGETDWKVIAIDVNDPLAEKLNDVQDLEKNVPGLLTATYEWFKFYKVPDGKPENNFAFNGEAKCKEYALKVIQETHGQWQSLVSAESESAIACQNTNVDDSPFRVSTEDAETIIEQSSEPQPAAEVSQEINKWHYVIQKQQ